MSNYFVPQPNPTSQYWIENPNPKRGTDRKWEDLDSNCLVNIFQRVGVVSMLMHIQLVCKSWHEASLTPAVWESFIFPENSYDPWNSEADEIGGNESYRFVIFMRNSAREFGIPWSKFTVPKLVNFVIKRSQGGFEFLKLPRQRCSVYTYAKKQILEHIKDNCSDFKGLHMADAYVTYKDASAMVRCVPKLKYLCLRRATLSRKSLLKILQGCRDIEVFDVMGCNGFDESDEEIFELASHIPKFLCSGSFVSLVVGPSQYIMPYDDQSEEEEGQQENQEEGQEEGHQEDEE